MKIISLILFFNILYINLFAQNFPPAAGQTGSTAIHKDSDSFISWANECTIERAYINISDTNQIDQESNYASYGEQNNALGKADNLVVSLGDGGIATYYFENPIQNNPGFDFAIFENGFNDTFLELAFVEVSSDGDHFIRFPSYSNTSNENQIETFGELDPTYILNLAGKYRSTYGTPFDLEDIIDSSNIDLNNILYIKIIDVIGSINVAYASFDANGNAINDPFPTPFYNCGFDLDALGILEPGTFSNSIVDSKISVEIFPNPANNHLNLMLKSVGVFQIELFNSFGILKFSKTIENQFLERAEIIDLSQIYPGIYYLRINQDEDFIIRKVVKTF